MNYRLVASPRATALRSVFTYLALVPLLALAGCAGKGGTTATGGNGGSKGSGGVTGTGGSSATGGSPGTGGSSATGGSVGTGGIVGTGGTPATGGSPGTGGTPATGGSPGTGGTTTVSDAGADATCQTADFTFVPKIPTVFLLIDRSGSEFTDATTGVFFNLRTAVLQVLQQLMTSNQQMRVGLGAFVGDHASGTCKPSFDTVAIGEIGTNYAAIAAKYNALGPLLPFGSKADTPMSAVIPMVQSALQADTGTGQKYMLVISDGQTDFCDDGNNVCPADAVTGQIQSMFTASLGTLVIGLPSQLGGGTAFNQAVLQGWANAGVGMNTALPTVGGAATATDVYNQCNGTADWKTVFTANGRTGVSSADALYTTPGGTATVFTPSSTSTSDLANQIAAAISAVKSCSFDLSDVGGKSIKVDTGKLASAMVKIQGTAVPLDATNGWNVTTSAPSTLVLNGNACKTWQTPNNNDISFAFPCSTIIFE